MSILIRIHMLQELLFASIVLLTLLLAMKLVGLISGAARWIGFGPNYEKVVSNIQEVKARKGRIIAIVTEGDVDVKKMAEHVIEIPETDESLVPLVSVVPWQLLSYHIAVMRGCNVDQPRNLAKSVTVE